MCGIAGYFSFKKQWKYGALEELGLKLCKMLHNRGPDGQGFYINASAGVVLAHTRLSIIDRTDHSSQPMYSPDGRWCLVYNGELYDYESLRADEARNGWCFKSNGDTEVLLARLLRYGDVNRALQNLDGMFAFAIFDSHERTLWIGRDQFGIKPLYYALTSDGFGFASSQNTLIAHLGASGGIDRNSMATKAIMRMEAGGEKTWLTGISMLGAGRTARIDTDGSFRLHTYRDITEGQKRSTDINTLEEAFFRAVMIRRHADVKIGAFCSGGIDSSGIIGAFNKAGIQPSLFCSIYEGSGGTQNDDHSFALQVAKNVGQPLHTIKLKADRSLEVIDDVVRLIGRPILHGAELALYEAYSHIRTTDVKVLFSGHGADELWGYQENGYFPIVEATIAGTYPCNAREAAALYIGDNPIWFRFLRENLLPALGVSDAEIEPRIWYEGLQEYTLNLEEDPRRRARRHLTKRFLTYVNDFVDALSMRFGIEERQPFQDLKLAEIAFALDEGTKNSVGVGSSKPYLRQALNSFIPKSVLLRPKTGFQPPQDAVFHLALLGYVLDNESCREFLPCLDEITLKSYPVDILLFIVSFDRFRRIFG